LNIIKAKNAGFCFGVRKAVEAVYDYVENNTIQVYTLGPIIHNDDVVKNLQDKGVGIIEEGDIPQLTQGTVFIRSHGVGSTVYDILKANDQIKWIDLTCPFVKRIHDIVSEYDKKGYTIIIVGKSTHPEVQGINGWCHLQGIIVENEADIEQIQGINKACIVAQTTISSEKWDQLLKIIQNKINKLEIFNTICHTTSERQFEASKIATQSDVVYVIGGKKSSNTQKLFEVCCGKCKRTFAIENANDIEYIGKYNPDLNIGIVAGASTPDWIIEEVLDKMSTLEQTSKETVVDQQEDVVEEAKAEQVQDDVVEDVEMSMEDVEMSMEDLENSMVTLHRGLVTKGTILKITDEEIIINLGYKSDGILPIEEVYADKDKNPKDELSVGDEIDVKIIEVNDGNGNVRLSRRDIEANKVWTILQTAMDEKKEFQAICKEVVKGGVVTFVEGCRVFVPASQLAMHFVRNLNSFENKEMRVRIIELDRRKKRVIGSQRVILEEEHAQVVEDVFAKAQPGERISGEVKRLTDFGAFVDIGGIDGLIHVSDLSWGRVKHPSDVLKPGDSVEVVVLKADKENEKISLSLKDTIPQPWDNIETKYPVGEIVEGTVARITGFGAFVSLEPGVDGLVHISQVADRRIEKVEDVLKIGDVVKPKVISVDPETKKISLSIRATIPREEKTEQYEQREPREQGEQRPQRPQQRRATKARPVKSRMSEEIQRYASEEMTNSLGDSIHADALEKLRQSLSE
jgi:4-hydroxy-3-methylbut-2-enyl diphosphate reductase